MSLETILNECHLNIARYEPVQGGDINRSFCLFGDDGKYFLKVNDANRHPGMFEKEATGLRALNVNGPIKVPIVIQAGISDREQYLLMEWIETGKPKKDFWETFGAGLAQLHKKEQHYFGWEADNYVGSLIQHNQSFKDWPRFFAECRIIPLVKRLFDAGDIADQDVVAAEAICKKLDQLFPSEPPSLLHGDLWNGNFMSSLNGEPVLFDPAVYNGHREMDLGMTKLFGGFDARFYDAYREVYPLENRWEQRLPVTELYPLLVHAILFGGYYVERIRDTLKIALTI